MSALEVLLTRMRVECDILVLTECWLASTHQVPQLEGYYSFSTKNNNNQNDGVVIYNKKQLAATVEEPTFREGNCLTIKVGNDTTIITIYRSPSFRNIDLFLTSLNVILSKLSAVKNVVIIGDINIAINDGKRDINADRYLSLAAYHGLLPAHSLITREKSGSCIDHVLLRTSSPAITLVPQASLTDHLQYKSACNFINSTSHKLNEEGLRHDIIAIDLSPIYESSNPDFAMTFLIQSLQTAIENNSQTFKPSRSKKIIKPWITQGLLRSIRNRDKLHKTAKRYPDNEISQTIYRRYRNFCNSLLKKVKRAYEKKQIDDAVGNNKKLWKAIKSITHIHKDKVFPRELLSLSATPGQSVNVVNDFFGNIAKTVHNNSRRINPPSLTHQNISRCHSKLDSFVLLETDEKEIENLILGLKNYSTVGLDNISNKVLKEYKSFLIHPLTHIFNMCLQSGVFPKILKRSLIYPIYKNGDRNCVSNYRPISILPSISKILERIVYNRLSNYLEKNNIFADSQFGFRNGKSTSDAVHELTNFIAQSLDSGKKCISIFLDLAKAFDTVSIPILLIKLEKLGVRGGQLELFKSYLSERYQCVKIGDHISTDILVTHGVPQGSILGPLLFLVYMNDLCLLKLTQGKLLSYADDTALIFTADSWENVFDVAQRGFNLVTKWLQDNSLTLNADKTKYLTLSIQNKNQPSDRFQILAHNCSNVDYISCSCDIIERSSSIKYLGIILDNNLNFKQHIIALSSRIRKLIYIFRNLRNVTSPSTLKNVYFALCQSLTTYCISSWGGVPKTTLKTLETAQRAVLKVSTFRTYMFPTKILYQSCKVLTVRQLFILNLLIKQHGELKFTPEVLSRRRKHITWGQVPNFKTAFIRGFYCFLGRFLYNKVNSLLPIYSLNKVLCKNKISNWLLLLSYEETEELLTILK